MSDAPNTTAIAQVIFAPTPAMIAAKTAFWARYKQLPVQDVSRINQTMAASVAKNRSIERWWSQPGFVTWFTDEKEFDQKIEYLARLSMEVAEQLLLDENVPAQAKVNLIKHLSELANKMPAKTKEIKYVDKDIGNMTDTQLDNFIEKNRHLIEAVPPKAAEGED